MKTALVTGAAGFIGRHISQELRRNSWHVHGIDVRDAFGVERVDAREFFRCSDEYYDLIVHAAAVVGGRQVIDGDPLAQAVNLELDAAMFAWARRVKTGRVVYISSSSVYPAWLQRPVQEFELDFKFTTSGTEHITGTGVPDRPLLKWQPQPLREVDARISDRFNDPDALYGWTKLTGEKLAELARADGLNVTVIRPFSGYGEDQDDCYPFPAFAARARKRENPFIIWGSGEQARDWIHVDDICRAVMVMVDEGIDGPVNVGNGVPVTMRELLAAMCMAARYNPQVIVEAGKPMGVMHRVADVAKMREFYTPSVSLEEGIERALRWESK